jgi:hypothetical protein
MKDMSKTHDQKAEEEEKHSLPIAIENDYPYGLCVSLNTQTLENLEVDHDDMPEVGDMIHLMAMAKVTSVRMTDSEHGPERCIELQITHLALEDEDDEYKDDE